jgi:hypothetical protein
MIVAEIISQNFDHDLGGGDRGREFAASGNPIGQQSASVSVTERPAHAPSMSPSKVAIRATREVRPDGKMRTGMPAWTVFPLSNWAELDIWFYPQRAHSGRSTLFRGAAPRGHA